MTALIPAVDLEPTPEQMAQERARFAHCADYVEARGELAPSTVHIEDLAAALASGRTLTVATMVRAMLAARRAYVERRAELDAAAAPRLAAMTDADATIRRLAELSAADQEHRTGGAR